MCTSGRAVKYWSETQNESLQFNFKLRLIDGP